MLTFPVLHHRQADRQMHTDNDKLWLFPTSSLFQSHASVCRHRHTDQTGRRTEWQADRPDTGFIQDFQRKIPWHSLTFSWPKYGFPDKWIIGPIPFNPSIQVKTLTVLTLTVQVMDTQNITIEDNVILGPVFRYQLFQKSPEVTLCGWLGLQ